MWVNLKKIKLFEEVSDKVSKSNLATDFIADFFEIFKIYFINKYSNLKKSDTP